MRHYRLNVKALGILIVVIVACGVGFWLLHGVQNRRHSANHLRLANEAREAGDLQEQAKELRAYSKLNPDDKEVVADYALVLNEILDKKIENKDEITLAEVQRAYSWLERAIRDAPKRADVRRKLIDFHMNTFRRYKDAIEHIDALLGSNPDDAAELRLQKVKALISFQQYDKAAEILYKLVGYFPAEDPKWQPDKAESPHNVDAYVRLAALFDSSHFDSEQRAEETLNQAIAVTDTEDADAESAAQAYLARASFYLTSKDYDEGRNRAELLKLKDEGYEHARSDVEKALELDEKNVTGKVLMASTHFARAALEAQREEPNEQLQKEHYQKTRTWLEKALTDKPDHERAHFILAQVELQEDQDVEAALKRVEAGLKELPNSQDLLILKADLLIQQQDIEGVRALADQMVEKKNLPRPVIDYLYAKLLLMERKWVEAKDELERLRPLLDPLPSMKQKIDFNLGFTYEKLGMLDLAREAARRSLQAAPTDRQSIALLRRVESRMGLADRAQTDLIEQKIAELEGESNIAVQEKLLNEWLKGLVDEGRISEVQEVLFRSEVWTRMGEYERGKDALREGLSKFPEEPALYLTGYTLVLRDPDSEIEDAERILALAEEKTGDSVTLRLAKANLILKRDEESKQEELEALTENVEGFSEDEKSSLYSGLLKSFLRANMTDQSNELLRKLGELNPTDLRVFLDSFNLALDRKNAEGMEDAIAKMTAVLGTADDPVVHYAKAARIVAMTNPQSGVDRDALKEAQEHLEAGLDARPNWHSLHQIQARVHLLSGNVAAAIQSYQQAMKLGPAQVADVRVLSQLLARTGNLAEAEKVLARLNDAQRETVDPQLRIVLALKENNVDEAIQLAEKAIENSPENPDLQSMYAQVLVRAEKPEEATAALRKAAELSPKDIKLRLRLFQYLLHQEKTAEAEQVMRNGTVDLPPAQVQFFEAQCMTALGRIDEAENLYIALENSRPDAPNVDRIVATFYLSSAYDRPDGKEKAKKYLREILETTTKETRLNPHAMWARRQLAVMLGARGKFTELLNAEEILEGNRLETGRHTPEDMLLLARLRAQRPEPVSRRRAIEIFEQLRDRLGELSTQDQLTLARLYYRANDWQKCRQTMTTLLGRERENAELVATFGEMILDRGQSDSEARRWVSRLRELAPNSPSALRATIRLLKLQGKQEVAVRELTKLVPENPTPETYPLANQVVGLLEEVDAIDEALQVLADYSEVTASATLRYADLAGRKGEVDRAFSIMEKAVASGAVPIVEVTRVAVSVMRSRREGIGAKNEQLIETWLQKLRDDQGESPQVLLQIAEFRELQGRLSEVETVYKKLLARDDLNDQIRAIVLNNLAFILAMQGRSAEECEKYINGAISILGPTAELLDTSAMVHLLLGDEEQAIKELNLSLDDKQLDTTYFHLALAKLAAGDKDAAYKAYAEAEKLGLTPEKVPPLEREQYDKLLRELNIPNVATS